MTNFIELHLQNGHPVCINVNDISGITPNEGKANASNNGWNFSSFVTMSNGSDENSYSIKESYEEVIAKIMKCAGTMVIK